MSGLLGKMLAIEAAPSEKGESAAVTPDKPDTEVTEDLMVFMRDFNNSELSETQRLAAFKALVKYAKE